MNLISDLLADAKAKGIAVPEVLKSKAVNDAFDQVTEVLDRLPLTPEERKAVGMMVAAHAIAEPT